MIMPVIKQDVCRSWPETGSDGIERSVRKGSVSAPGGTEIYLRRNRINEYLFDAFVL